MRTETGVMYPIHFVPISTALVIPAALTQYNPLGQFPSHTLTSAVRR